MSRIPHCWDNRPTAVRLSALCIGHALLPRIIIFFFATGTHFPLRLSKPQGIVRLEGLSKHSITPIGSPTHDLPACRVVSQSLCYRVPSSLKHFSKWKLQISMTSSYITEWHQSFLQTRYCRSADLSEVQFLKESRPTTLSLSTDNLKFVL
jgi:hypothetical protein